LNGRRTPDTELVKSGGRGGEKENGDGLEIFTRTRRKAGEGKGTNFILEEPEGNRKNRSIRKKTR